MAFGRGEAPDHSTTNIRELGEVAAGLEKAFHVLQHRTAERDQAERGKEAQKERRDSRKSSLRPSVRAPHAAASIAASLDLLKEIADAARSDAGRELIGIAHANGNGSPAW